MTIFEKLKAEFQVNWTTVLVGWRGLGVYSPWPDRWAEFPPLLSISEVVAYADGRLESSSDEEEIELLASLSSWNLQEEGREKVLNLLNHLSELDNGNQSIEIRKWRVICLGQLLESLPQDAIYGLIALTEFWQDFGFPPDSPHEVQGRENKIAPDEYYQQENFARLLNSHISWIKDEIEAIRRHKQSS